MGNAAGENGPGFEQAHEILVRLHVAHIQDVWPVEERRTPGWLAPTLVDPRRDDHDTVALDAGEASELTGRKPRDTQHARGTPLHVREHGARIRGLEPAVEQFRQ